MRRLLLAWGAWLALASAVRGGPGEGAPPRAEPKLVDYAIVVTGTELLEGAYPDAHTHFLTRTLRPLGYRCVGARIVEDRQEDLAGALHATTNKVALVIVTGGLGPTPNDITRETLAEATGIRLHEHPEVLAAMEQRFQTNRDQLRPNLRRQCQVPTRGSYLKNPAGTAVGLVFDAGGPVVVALPGPPRELQPMVRNELIPFLRQRFGVRPLGPSVTLRFVGVGQSVIDQTIKDHVALTPDVIFASSFEGSRVDIDLSLPGSTPEDHARLERLREQIREHLGEFIYAEDGSSLEQVIVKRLAARGGALVLAEVGSSGHVTASLSKADGFAALVAGAYVAPTPQALARLLGVPAEKSSAWAPGAETAQGLGSAATALTGSQWAVVVGPPESVTGGARQVWVAFKQPPDRWEAGTIAIRDAGEIGAATLTTQVLDRLRRWLK